MSWPTTKTWNAGDVVTDTDMNTEVRDRFNLVKTQISDDGHALLKVAVTVTGTGLSATDDIMLAGGTITISLPTAATAQFKPYIVKNVGVGVITVNVSGGIEQIDGAATYTLAANQVAWFIPWGTSAWTTIVQKV